MEVQTSSIWQAAVAKGRGVEGRGLGARRRAEGAWAGGGQASGHKRRRSQVDSSLCCAGRTSSRRRRRRRRKPCRRGHSLGADDDAIGCPPGSLAAKPRQQPRRPAQPRLCFIQTPDAPAPPNVAALVRRGVEFASQRLEPGMRFCVQCSQVNSCRLMSTQAALSTHPRRCPTLTTHPQRHDGLPCWAWAWAWTWA
jgi:hypothetical protein